MAFVVDSSTRARLSLTGADARAFLHRMSTQHVKDLAPGDGRLNALLTDKGRLVDVVHHLDRGPRGVLLVGSPGKDLAAWLDRYLFTEKVELAPETGLAYDVWGEDADEVVERIVPGARALLPWGFVEDVERGVVVVRAFDRVVRHKLNPYASYIVIGTGRGLELNADDATFERARIESGVPGRGEIVEAYTPLDLGLHDAIHWAKGCYIGQEVIARLDTYQKQHKRLVTLGSTSHGAPDFRVGAAVYQGDGPTIGTVTSASENVALAVVKLPDDGMVDVDGGPEATARIPALAHTPKTAQKPHD